MRYERRANAYDAFDKILHFFAEKKSGRSKNASREVCPTEAHYGQCPWLCYVSGAAPSRLRKTMRNAKRIHKCLQISPTTFCTPTPNLFLLLDAA